MDGSSGQTGHLASGIWHLGWNREGPSGNKQYWAGAKGVLPSFLSSFFPCRLEMEYGRHARNGLSCVGFSLLFPH